MTPRKIKVQSAAENSILQLLPVRKGETSLFVFPSKTTIRGVRQPLTKSISEHAIVVEIGSEVLNLKSVDSAIASLKKSLQGKPAGVILIVNCGEPNSRWLEKPQVFASFLTKVVSHIARSKMRGLLLVPRERLPETEFALLYPKMDSIVEATVLDGQLIARLTKSGSILSTENAVFQLSISDSELLCIPVHLGIKESSTSGHATSDDVLRDLPQACIRFTLEHVGSIPN